MKRSLMQVYIKNSAEAVQFYHDAFDAKVLCDHRQGNGAVAHAELDVYGQILAICETIESEVVTGNSMQFCLHFGEGNEELVKSIISKLADGGELTFHDATDWSPLVASIIDRYGVNWCIFV